MIIDCGNRRLVSDRYGWTIQIKKVRESGNNIGEERWEPDRPAYPCSLARALEMITEREMQESGDIGLTDVTAALNTAYKSIHDYMKKVREAV